MAQSQQLSAPAPPFGRLLKEWRAQRGFSQLSLALDCGVSQRHLSFLESGRARPSREMALHLASALAMPLVKQNELLAAAGFAPAFKERRMDAPEMSAVEQALARTLAQQEPFPAVVLNRRYDLIRANAAAGALLAFLMEDLPPPADGRHNFVRLILAEDRLRSRIENWEQIAVWLVRRMRAEALADGIGFADDPEMAALLAEPRLNLLARGGGEPEATPALTARFRRGDTRLALFSFIATVGTPFDTALQDLRLEFFFPADAGTERWFRDRARS